MEGRALVRRDNAPLVLAIAVALSVMALAQAERAVPRDPQAETWTPYGVALVIGAIGSLIGGTLAGFAAVINARGSQRAAERAEQQSIRNGEKAAAIETKVDGGRERQDQLIAQLQADLKRMHDELMATQRERVADVKETAAQAAAVAAAVADAPKGPIPVVLADRRKDDGLK